MAAVAFAAIIFWVLFAAWACLNDLRRSLHAFYGPGGPIALRTQFYQEPGSGSQALWQGDFDAAEGHYTAALKLAEMSHSKDDQIGWYDVPAALIGLADALAGRGQFDEADPL